MEILLLIFLGLTAFFFFFARDKDPEDTSGARSIGSDTHGDESVTIVRPANRSNRVGRVQGALGFIEAVADAAGQAIGTMAAIAVGTVVIGTSVAAYLIREGIAEYQRAHGSVDANREREHREREVSEINSEIVEFERKRSRDGRLNENEDRDLNELIHRRHDSALLLAEANEILIADNVAKGGSAYDNVHVSDLNTHILQFHVGQTVFGKVCRQCGTPMVLQWQQRLETVQMRDFFWGCAGFYDGKCRNIEPFVRSDMTLFTNTDREEFSISTSELTSIARIPQSVRLIRHRMDGLVNVANSTYYCPVHHEPMVLRTKRDADTLRDMYFYGCPRWRPSGPTCKQIVKLKSASQLSAALETMSGRGIL